MLIFRIGLYSRCRVAYPYTVCLQSISNTRKLNCWTSSNTCWRPSYGSSIFAWGTRHCIWNSTCRFSYCLIYCSLWVMERSTMGLDYYYNLVDYQHRLECNYNCYCCQFWWSSQHYHKRSNHLLPIQTACQGVFWQRGKSTSTCCMTYRKRHPQILIDYNGWSSRGYGNYASGAHILHRRLQLYKG